MPETTTYTFQHDLRAFREARDRGERCRIDAEMFYYYLEVLPPYGMRCDLPLCDGTTIRASFGFAEGAEIVTAFWRAAEADEIVYYAQRTTVRASGY